MPLTPEQLRKLRRAPAERGRNRLKVARELAGLTQVQLSDMLGLTQSSLSDLERQRFGTTTIDTGKKFSEFFGCALEDLWPAKAEVA